MTSNREETKGVVCGDGGFHRVQAERDLQSNWEVDLSQKLEEYLLKICSGEIPSESDGCVPVNFAEAALLLQGSVQVYSRKVEYLYSLVLRALEFLSQKRQQEQLEGTSVQPQGNDGSEAAADEDSDIFWGLDDIPVESKTCLDSSSSNDALLDCFVKPPINLVVLEGDCLDSSGDAGELESYLLASSDLYRGFILLDPCDAVAVHDYLNIKKVGKGQNNVLRCSSNRKNFLSPMQHSGGTVKKSSLGKDQVANISQSPLADCTFDVNNCETGSVPQAFGNYDSNHDFDMDDRCSEPGEFDDSDDEDDPWKPLNPHEPGNLKVKPFRKVKAHKRNWASGTKQGSLVLFPHAKLHGTVSAELMKLWEMQCHAQERQPKSQSPPLYEKLRQSLINEEHETFNASFNLDDGNEDTGFGAAIPDFEQPDDDMPEDMFMDEDLPFHSHDEGDANSGVEPFAHDYPNSHASLEELCRSHLDALLASIAETEKQSELAARVSTWKQKIEHNLEEQDSHPEFDIHDYGRRILDKLSHKADDKNVLSYADVVSGQEKYDVARSFSALLQLVNNGDVELERSVAHGKSVCYTAVNPFRVVRVLSHEKQQKAQFQLPRKRVKSPTKKACTEVNGENCETGKSRVLKSASKVYRSTEIPLHPNCKFSVKVGKIGTVCCTPDGKRRRRSRVVEPVDQRSAL